MWTHTGMYEGESNENFENETQIRSELEIFF